MKKDEPKESIEVIEPPVGKVKLQDGKIIVQVRVTGQRKVRSVHAQAFQGQPPEVPEPKLTPSRVEGVYEGSIPAFLGLFEIKAMVEFEDGERLFCEEGPYKGVTRYTTNEADIVCPVPGGGDVKIATNGSFRVRVRAVAADPNVVGQVFAQCFRIDGTPIDTEVQLNSAGGNIWAGNIKGRHGDFRIVARAVINDDTGAPIIEVPDEDGPYTGCPNATTSPCP